VRRSIAFIAIPVLFALTLACTFHYTNKGGMPNTVSAPTFIPEVPASTVLPIPTELEEPTPEVAVPTEPEGTPAPTLVKLGETAEGGGVSLTALQVIDPATPNESYTVEEGMRLVAVEVVVGNVSAAGHINVTGYSFSVWDIGGTSYVAALLSLDNLIATGELDAGEKLQGWTAFAVPVSANLVSIAFDPDMFVLDDVIVRVGLTP
jgi:hypothetical protein